ncbi:MULTISPECIES: hypothetical protein [unclassified Streptomyces]|nr:MULTISPECIES: hypothetical protein [unclassified Streptomyces]MDF3146968.1 hypothetical protein [Streptomyces sp. T21Q-yed]WDF37334.1 hypothetical protein PBV52_11310 [Streptomyces sp. T12]
MGIPEGEGHDLEDGTGNAAKGREELRDKPHRPTAETRPKNA